MPPYMINEGQNFTSSGDTELLQRLFIIFAEQYEMHCMLILGGGVGYLYEGSIGNCALTQETHFDIGLTSK